MSTHLTVQDGEDKDFSPYSNIAIKKFVALMILVTVERIDGQKNGIMQPINAKKLSILPVLFLMVVITTLSAISNTCS